MYIPAVDNNGATEEIFESIDTPPQFQEEVWLPWDTVVWPAYELDVSHLPLRVLLPLLHTHTHTDDNANLKKNTSKSSSIKIQWTRFIDMKMNKHACFDLYTELHTYTHF